MEIEFVVPGAPRGQQRTGAISVGGHVQLYDQKESRQYKEDVRVLAMLKARRQKWEITKQPVEVDIMAVFPIPNSWSQQKKADALLGKVLPTVKPDLDNIAKIITDPLTGLIWADDKQMIKLRVCKHYGEEPKVCVRIRTVEDSDG